MGNESNHGGGRWNEILEGPQDAGGTYVYMSTAGYCDVRLDDRFSSRLKCKPHVLRSALLLITVQAITPWNIETDVD